MSVTLRATDRKCRLVATLGLALLLRTEHVDLEAMSAVGAAVARQDGHAWFLSLERFDERGPDRLGDLLVTEHLLFAAEAIEQGLKPELLATAGQIEAAV